MFVLLICNVACLVMDMESDDPIMMITSTVVLNLNYAALSSTKTGQLNIVYISLNIVLNIDSCVVYFPIKLCLSTLIFYKV